MSFSPRLFLSSLVCCALATSAALAESPHAAGWQLELATAQAQAKQLHKPVLLHFYADWCGPCKQMEATVFEAAEFKKLLGKEVVAVKINGDYHSDLISRFRIQAYPADVFLSPDGKELKRSMGRVSLDQYVSLIHNTAAPFQVAEKKSPAKPDVKTVVKVRREALGLEGYSPVALVVDSAWVKGLPEHQETYQGLTFHFANADEQAQFQANPDSFCPKYLGCDPVALKESGRAVAGSIQHGAVYEGQIYFMSSEQHQKTFLAAPQDYVDLLYDVSLDTPQIVQTEGKSAAAPTN